MFEIRDDLMISIILECSNILLSQTHSDSPYQLVNLQISPSKIQTEMLLKTISSFSYETVASKPKFRDSRCIESIGLFICRHPKARDRFRAIVKEEIMQYEENSKYLREELDSLHSIITKKESPKIIDDLSLMLEERI